jgi:hypothetical protein
LRRAHAQGRRGGKTLRSRCHLHGSHAGIMLSIMRRNWLWTSLGINVVAIGLFAIAVSLIVFTVQDLAILVTGKPYVLHGVRGIWYLLCATIAALFSVMTIFIWRLRLPRIVIGLFSISMASHILEQFVALPADKLKVLALFRLLVAMALTLLVWRYGSTTTSGTSE